MITTTDPGELFLIRNAGNIIPPYSAASHGEGATIEYAISVLHISNIIVCGHSQCGAMEALLRKDSVKDLPAVAQWFSYAEGTRRVAKRYEGLTPAERARAVTQQNVLVQIQNLNTHPCVISGIEDGNLKVFGWYYDIGTGRVFQYRQEGRKFEDISLCGDHVACNGTGINSLRGGMHGPNLYLD
jgi:carbonic anhydrase